MGGDLFDLAQRDTQLRRVATTHGGEYAGPCPFCGGTDRFHVWPEHEGGARFWCRQCERGGDLIAYRVERGDLTAGEAYAARHGGDPLTSPASTSTTRATPPLHLPDACDPPNATWQAHAWELTATWQAELWGEGGTRALTWLQGRGLDLATIERAGLGYNPADVYEPREAWGLDPDPNPETGKPRRVWLPRGVVIPWFIGPDLWRLNIRRPVGDPKYTGPAGCGCALYEADRLAAEHAAVICEGELDALTLHQAAGDLAAAVATGSTGGARRARWLARLALCSRVLIAFDADDAGDRGRRYWLQTLPNAATWRPYWNDANAMAQGGADLRGWLSAGLVTPGVTRKD